MKYFLGLLKKFWQSLGKADLYRNISKALWLFFPSVLFVVLIYFAFWHLSQGKDLMVYTIEHRNVYLFFIIAIIFFAYLVWYSSRLVTKAKLWEDENYLWLKVRVHTPRFLSFTVFTVIILAFLKLDIGESPKMKSNWAMYLLLFSFFYYLILNRAWTYIVFIKKYSLKGIYIACVFIILASAIAVYLFKTYIGLVILMAILQVITVLYFLARRRDLQMSVPVASKRLAYDYGGAKGISLLLKKMQRLIRDPEEKGYLKFFNVIAIIALCIYISAIFSVRFSGFLGSFPLVFLAFGVLLGFINLLVTLSIFTRFNIHLLLWAFAFIVGLNSEPHNVKLIKKKKENAFFDKRQKLQEYFTNWVQSRYPNPDSIQKSQPLYFVLANGGASRSGYWAASILSRFEDSTNGKFSKNLFCISGASGGSVGNAAFFNILRNKKLLLENKRSCLSASNSYLGSDFLTYTLARMLGPDIFRYIFPFLMPVKDRAYALTKSLEEASGSDDLLYETMSTGMSEIISQVQQPDSLPILCINTTRMQDGRPAVISTINLNDVYFNQRVDVLSLIDEDKDLKMSSAVVLGASFPYVSPAGRLNFHYNQDDSSKLEQQYYVDGGYFDNSGAGVVNEMIIGMQQLMNTDSILRKYKNKLDFFVVHITNDPTPGGEPVLKKVNPLINDLAAPVQTLVGAYGSQTSVNNSRLKSYMYSNFGEGHYTKVNLYKLHDPMSFSMNWVISQRALDSMKVRLEDSPEVKTLLKQMQQE